MLKMPLRFLYQFAPDLRLFMALLCLVLGFYLSLQHIPLAVVLALCALLLCWDALRYGTVWPALDAFKFHQHESLR